MDGMKRNELDFKTNRFSDIRPNMNLYVICN